MSRLPAHRVLGTVLLAFGLSGCAAQTLTGHGAAIPAAPSPSAIAVPAPSQLPTRSTAAAPPASASAPSTGSDPSADGILITDPAGHFRVRMPGKPKRSSEPWSYGGYTITVHIDVATSPYIAIVEGEDVKPALTVGSFDLVLATAITGFESTSHLRLVHQATTTFQGHQARRAIFSAPGGTRFEFLVFVYSGAQLYAMAAPDGPEFEALAASFEATV